MLSRKLLKLSTSICTFSRRSICSSGVALFACFATSLKAMPELTTALSSDQLLWLCPFSSTAEVCGFISGAILIHFPGETPTAMMSMRQRGGRKRTARSGRFHGVSMEGTREKTASPASSRLFKISSMFSGFKAGSGVGSGGSDSMIDLCSLLVASLSISRSCSEKFGVVVRSASLPTNVSIAGNAHSNGSVSLAHEALGDNPFV
mmetsp:Transcript_49432/g.117317  ORF Transcript_49432/g.117317 Transcript_49432/m.117317 type:complete len:205 (+) Transcript_49432:683-1297(+)